MVKLLEPRTHRPKGILFDHDGVLVSSEQLHFIAWQELIRRMGLPFEKIRMENRVGRTAPVILTAILDEFRPGWKPVDYPLDALAKQKNDIYLEYAALHLAPYPGVREGLAWCREKGIACAVVSNAKRRELEFSMENLGLRKHFDSVLSRDDLQHPKPHPAAFAYGAISLGLKPEDCIAIDDSPTGLESGLLAGCRCASVTTNYDAGYLRTPIPGRPDLKLEWIGANMAEFFDWIRSLPV